MLSMSLRRWGQVTFQIPNLGGFSDLKKAKLPWRGFHTERRGLGTKLRELTGDSTAAKNVLRQVAKW